MNELSPNSPGQPLISKPYLIAIAGLLLVALLFGEPLAKTFSTFIGVKSSSGYTALYFSNPDQIPALQPGDRVSFVIENHTNVTRQYTWTASQGKAILARGTENVDGGENFTSNIRLSSRSHQDLSITLEGLRHEIHAKLVRR